MSAAVTEPLELLARQLDKSRPGSDELVRGLCEQVCELTSLTRMMLLVGAPDGGMSIAHAVGFEHILAGGTAAGFEDMVMALSLLDRKTGVYMADARSLGIAPRLIEALGLSSLAVCAAGADGGMRGLLIADRADKPLLLGDRDVEQLALIADTIGVAVQLQRHALSATLAWRLDLVREIHDDVIQRLYGVSVALSTDDGWTDSQRTRCQAEITRGLGDLRALLDIPLGGGMAPHGLPRLRDELDDLSVRHPDLPVQVIAARELPELNPDLAQMVRHFLDEALRNVRKHASPSWVRVSVLVEEMELTVTVHNDGLLNEPAVSGMGLRLLEAETLLVGGRVNHGSPSSDCWRVSLAVPHRG